MNMKSHRKSFVERTCAFEYSSLHTFNLFLEIKKMSWRMFLGRNVRSVKILACPTSPSSATARYVLYTLRCRKSKEQSFNSERK